MDAVKLIEKMRRAREARVETLGHVFTVRIPTDGELADLSEGLGEKALTYRRIVEAFTVGWDMTEADLIPGGDAAPATFAPDLFREWLGANMEAAEPLFAAISAGIEARREPAKN